MFDGRAFQSWGHVLVGATVLAGLFFGMMMMAEKVIGGRMEVNRAVLVIAGAAFVGYLGTAWILRREETADRTAVRAERKGRRRPES